MFLIALMISRIHKLLGEYYQLIRELIVEMIDLVSL